ncbi:MAG: hypothetical protein PHY93_17350 [Bacteriovorax sp.]|nr:hypothetical protein [Bacteriovorax sp.]
MVTANSNGKDATSVAIAYTVLIDQWIEAITFGHTHDLWKNENYKIGIRSLITKNIIPSHFENYYGKGPLAGKIFISCWE